jgi:hypothetical protein
MSYVEERNFALVQDLDRFIDWAMKYTEGPPPPRRIIEISYHQLRTACIGLPMEARSISKKWLLDHGYRSWDDGDVPCEEAT